MRFCGYRYLRNEEFDDYTIIGDHHALANQIDFDYDIIDQLRDYAEDWGVDSNYIYYVYFQGFFDGEYVSTMDGTEYEVEIGVDYCTFSLVE